MAELEAWRKYTETVVDWGDATVNFLLHETSMGYGGSYSIMPHFHTFWECHIFNGGTYFWDFGGRREQAQAGDVLIVAPFQEHYPISSAGETRKAGFLFVFGKNKSRGAGIGTYKLLQEIFSSIPGYFILRGAGLYERYYADIIGAVRSDDTLTRFKISALFQMFLIELAGHVAAQNGVDCRLPPGTDDFAGQTDNTRIFNIDEYLNRSNKSETTLKSLADHVHMSEKQVARIVESTSGASFGALMLKRRMAIARTLLQTTDLSLQQVAEEAGYGSYNGFYQAVRAYFGKSPQELREEKTGR